MSLHLDSRASSRLARARRIRGLVVAAALALAVSLILSKFAHAQGAPPKLRGEVTVAGDVVTLADLLENAGPHGNTAVFRAPDLGTTGSVEAARVLDAAREAGIREIDFGGRSHVIVSRSARELGATDFARLMVQEIGKQDRSIDVQSLQVTFDDNPGPIAIDTRTVIPTRIASFAWSPVSNRFDAVVSLDRGNGIERIRLRGAAEETVEVVMINRVVDRGEVVGRDDFSVERRPKRAGTATRPVDISQLAGQAARRPMRQGQQIVAADFAPPMLVNRHDTVTIVYEAPGLMLSVKGQALESGAKGQTINVLNQQSKRTIQATVAGPGKVAIRSGLQTTVAGVSQ